MSLWILGAAACSAPSPDAARDARPADAAPCTQDATCGDDGDPVARIAARFPPCPATAREQTLTFVHVNDLHASYNPVDGESPWARARGVFEQAAAENPYTLFTDGGDSHEKGSLAELRSGGWATLEAVHAMRFDLRVLGNHDFAWNREEALAFSWDPHGVVLATNIRPAPALAERFGARPVVFLPVGCLRLGVIGLVSQPWSADNEPVYEDYYPDLISDYDYVGLTAETLAAHRDEADLWILLSHLGVAVDERLAEALPELDVILGGHSHTRLPRLLVVGQTAILQTGAYGQFVGRLDLTVDLDSGRVTARQYRLIENAPGRLPLSLETEAALEAIVRRHAPDLETPVAFVRAPQSKPDIARLAAEAALHLLDADAVLVDLDEVWGTWDAGGITPQQMLDAFKVERQPPGTPGFNSFWRVTVSHEDVLRLLSALDPDRWLLAAPVLPPPGAPVRLVVQKHVLSRPGHYLPDVTLVGNPEFADEVHAVLEAHGRLRTAACRYLDTSAPLPDCSGAEPR